MKVAVVGPHRPAWPKTTWVEQAFRAIGCDTRRVTRLDQLATAAAECDLCLFEQRNAGLNPGSLVQIADQPRRARFVQWWFDGLITLPGQPPKKQPSIFTPDGQERNFLRVLRAMDAVFIKEHDVDQFREIGINAHWMPQACPSWMRARPEVPIEYDVCLFGNSGGGYRQRTEDVQSLVKAGFSVLWAGSWNEYEGVTVEPFVQPEDLPDFVARASVTLVVDGQHDVPGYHSDRVFLAAGAGATIVRRHTPEFHGPWLVYRDAVELVETVAQLLDGRLMPVAGFGPNLRAFILSGHTYEHRAQQILKHQGGASCLDQPIPSAGHAAATARS